jgi:hypothetical protein
MGLYSLLFVASGLCFVIGGVGALMCLLSGSRMLKVYVLGLLSLVMAAAPFTVSRFAVQVVVAQRSLMETD